ncbi:MAG: PEGA domain-containing protein, partial [Myxococcota bacterium]|nr:PEGA domain-containing protein [Myxococcota bacterium]
EALETFRGGLSAPETDQLETWQLLLGAALASEKLDQGANAIEYYRRFLDASEGAQKLLPPKWRTRREVVSDAVDELQRTLNKSHGYLTISSTPEAAAIFVDGKRAGVDGAATTPFGLFLTAATYEIRLEKSGHEPAVSTVAIEVGKLKPLSLTLVEIAPEPPPPPVVAPPTTEESAPAKSGLNLKQIKAEESSGGGLATPGWIAIGGGSAMVVGGVVCTILAGLKVPELEDYEERSNALEGPEKVQHDAEWGDEVADFNLKYSLSFAFYGVGAAAIAAGVVLVILDTGVGGGSESAADFGITPTRGGAFGQATLRF